MKALSLIQPWATLVMLGGAYKGNETRSWKTKHRGLLGIHASKATPPYAREACNDPLIKAALETHGLNFKDLPRGVLLGTVEVVEMHPITAELVAKLTPMELAAGDYTLNARRYAWELKNVVKLPEPIEMTGGLSLWNALLPSDEN